MNLQWVSCYTWSVLFPFFIVIGFCDTILKSFKKSNFSKSGPKLPVHLMGLHMVNVELSVQGEFFVNAKKLLERLEFLMLAIQSKQLNPTLADDILRIAHSLKSSSLAAGFTGFGEMAYRFETFLDHNRQIEIVRNSPLSDHIFAYHDLLQAYVEGLELDPNFKLEAVDTGFSNLPSKTSHDDATVSPVSNSSEQGVNKTAVSVGVNNSDDNLYYRAFMRGSHSQFPNEDAVLYRDMSQLGIPGSQQTTNFATIALNVFRAHPFFVTVSRVALIRRVGLSNQLEVVSSASDVQSNNMTTGYRCFVAPTGSLFKLSPHSMRVFGSAKTIVGEYERRGQPAQRSIARVAKMGLESGIATGVFSGSNMIGLLFINATDKALAQLPPDALPLIGNLSILAHRRFLDLNLDSFYMGSWGSEHSELCGDLYSYRKLTKAFGAVSRRLKIAPLDLQIEGPDSLSAIVVHHHVAYLICRLATLRPSLAVTVTVSIESIFLVFSCVFGETNGLHQEQMNFEVLVEDARYLGFELKVIGKCEVLLSTNLDFYQGNFAEAPYSMETEKPAEV